MSSSLFQLPSSASYLHHKKACSISLSSTKTAKPTQHSSDVTRRSTTLLLTMPLLSVLVQPHSSLALDLRLTVPDQTFEEAESVIKSHAQQILLDVKELLNSESSWKEAQRQLRKSSALLKQDLYTIIQGKSPELRPKMRKLYADLFNEVLKFDYAVRDKDRDEVWECFDTVVMVLNEILSTV